MRFFDRLSNGWALGKTSLKTIHENPSLMLFPVMSGAALILVSISFFGSGYLFFGEQILALLDDTASENTLNAIVYVLTFLFYLITYFVIVFFNVGLVHCAKMIFAGKEANFNEGVRYAMTRINTILAWAFLAATVGIILKTIQERAGGIGKIISGIIGLVWGIATFFVVPVIAYEDVNPIQAVKRSAQIMKAKWGESIGANFSFGIFTFLGILVAIALGFLTGYLIHPIVGVISGILAFILIQIVVSAAELVFIAAVYQHVNNEPVGYFEDDVLDSVFVQK